MRPVTTETTAIPLLAERPCRIAAACLERTTRRRGSHARCSSTFIPDAASSLGRFAVDRVVFEMSTKPPPETAVNRRTPSANEVCG